MCIHVSRYWYLIRLNGKTVGTVVLAIFGALLLGIGFERLIGNIFNLPLL
ncbi:MULTISPECIES: hypothetical protein [Blautia]|nr:MULTISPECIES: hypothetical protein [Blautia]